VAVSGSYGTHNFCRLVFTTTMGAPAIVPTFCFVDVCCHASASGPSSLFRAPVPSPSSHARDTCPGATVGELTTGVPHLTCCWTRASKLYYKVSARSLAR